MKRRHFLNKSIAATAGITAGFSFEEKNLLARADTGQNISPQEQMNDIPVGQIGDVKISRLIVGGNLTSFIAHSRDLIYVSSLLRGYFTDDKIFETWEISEECGINSAILRLDENVVRLVNTYWKDRGGKLQWIVQIKPKNLDLSHFKKDIQWALDNGAIGAYIQGNVADRLVQHGNVDLIGEAIQYIKSQGVIAGIGGHSLEVPKACEEAELDPDFYMKTLHSPNYWTFNPDNDKWDKFHVSSGNTHDNVWCTEPEETAEFMKQVNKPWIAFKVMAAGAVHPMKAFQYAFDNGADFICAGMFDFQVREDAIIARNTLKQSENRQRAWFG